MLGVVIENQLGAIRMKTNRLNRVKYILKLPFRSASKIFKREKKTDSLTNTQKSFVIWNAERLNISEEESTKRYLSSWNSIVGGHSGKAYRSFNNLSHELYKVFNSDVGDELYAAYEHHSHMHFLRMLSYSEPQWSEKHVVVQHLNKYPTIDIIDYGCGLAQISRSLAHNMKKKGKIVRLFLVDIPTIRKEFLLWLGGQSGIETQFLDSTVNSPIPTLPDCDICIATEFFEHVFDPLKYFNEMHAALRKNGLLITRTEDHKKEFMHVSPNLQTLRTKIQELNYDVIKENQILRKTA